MDEKEIDKETEALNDLGEERTEKLKSIEVKRKSAIRDSLQRLSAFLPGSLIGKNGQAKEKPEGFLAWMHILRAISDEDLRHICGGDAALYVLFIRYACFFFFFMTLFNLIILIPIYASGEPADPSLLIDKDTSSN